MLKRIFGKHGFIFSDAKQLLGDFSGHLEHVCFTLLEEALLAGDPRVNDKVKSQLTSSEVFINPKNRQGRMISNQNAVMLCTNHLLAIPANPGERRWFMLALVEKIIGDKEYFDDLHDDLANGGDGQFLNWLLNMDLKGFHPRDAPKTDELGEQQLMSMKGPIRWLWECAERGYPVTGRQGYSHSDKHCNNLIGAEASLGDDVEAAELRNAYYSWAKDRGIRQETENVVGKDLTTILGKRSENRRETPSLL